MKTENEIRFKLKELQQRMIDKISEGKVSGSVYLRAQMLAYQWVLK